MAAVSGVRCAQGIARPSCPLRSTLTRTPPPKPSPLGSIAHHLSLRDNRHTSSLLLVPK